MMRTILISFLIIMSVFINFQLYAQKIEEKDGVKIIHNDKPKWGSKPKVALEFVRQIGKYESEDQNYQFFRPRDIIKDKEGNIYVLDAGNHRIQKFNPDGKYIATFGRKGQGPGEFMNPFELDLDNNNSIIYVSDQGNHRVQKYSIMGKENGSFKMEKAFDWMCLTNSGNIVAQTSWFTQVRQGYKYPTLLSFYDNKGRFIRAFGRVDKYNYSTFAANIVQFVNDSKDDIYAVFLYQNRIDKYSSDGELLFTMKRPIKFKIDYNKEKKPIMVSADIDIDTKGRIWVITYLKQPSERANAGYFVKNFEFEIFNREGILLGKVPSPEHNGVMRIINNLLYLIDMTEEMCIFEYKIVDL